MAIVAGASERRVFPEQQKCRNLCGSKLENISCFVSDSLMSEAHVPYSMLPLMMSLFESGWGWSLVCSAKLQPAAKRIDSAQVDVHNQFCLLNPELCIAFKSTHPS